VESVVLFAESPLDQLHRIELDTASLTSVNLIRILADWHGMAVEFVEGDRARPTWPLPAGTGRLIIGDEALRRRGTCAVEWDLAQAWIDRTGLPFVFAAWHTPDPALAEPGSPVHELFLRMAELVPGQIEPAARLDGPAFGFEPQTALDYLSRAIHFAFGDREKDGLDRFRIECERLGLLAGVEVA
jgi:predicted solute-binding protein